MEVGERGEMDFACAILCADLEIGEAGMRTRVVGVAVAATVGLALTAAPAHAAELGSEGGFTYVKNSKNLGDTTDGSTAAKELEAHCPDGAVPTGGGTSISGDPHASYVAASGPKQKSWLSSGWHSNTEAAKVTSWGICTEKKGKVRVASEVVNVAGGTAGSSAVPCGQDAAVGGGVRPALGIAEWWLTTTYPQDGGADSDEKPDDQWFSVIWHQTGFFPPLDVSIYAVCMEDTKVSYKANGVAFSTQVLVTASVECPNSKSVAGGGAALGPPASQAHVVKTQPIDSDDKGKVPDDGWAITIANPTMAEMDVVAYAACV